MSEVVSLPEKKTFEPPDQDPVFAPEPGQNDSLATAEANSLANGKSLQSDGEAKEHQRHQSFRDHVNRATLGIFWAIAVSIGLGVIAYTFHLLTPPSWHFLEAAQLESVKTILISALFSSALSGYAGKRMA
ncbi:hypothetical protein HNP55_001008 [Paucibacter oligotrophus]|uniref:Uncharacterized protein n=1 Tax=Roseateles oligotrophus TaxID=1769250 RepID=A0A840L6S0_9BURK|nr:hypothetical protein [Roseateles oligotrophus]MBB4842493.1 hypothetical protein [Roseateles oligotrophus]